MAQTAPPETSRLWLTAGAAARDFTHNQNDEPLTTVRGLSPTTLQLGGAWYFKPWLGAALEARGERFYATRDDMEATPQWGVEATALAAFRWRPGALFGLEGQAGWAALRAPLLTVNDPGTVSGDGLWASGPALGAAVDLLPTSWLAAQLYARGVVPVSARKGVELTAGVRAQLGALRLGPGRWGIALSYEWARARLTYDAETVLQVEHRLGLGVAFLGGDAPAPVVQAPDAAETDTRLEGLVLSAGQRAPIAGAVVEAGGQRASSDAQGHFELGGLTPGAITVAVTAAGYRLSSRDATLEAGRTTTVEVELVMPTGPGQLRGVVKAAGGGPLEGVLVRVEDGPETKTDAAGAFNFPKVGPGPVTVTAALTGYQRGEEAVQVPPEAESTVDFTLAAVGVHTLATVKGLIQGSDGGVPRATVKLRERKVSVKVKPDGRFELSVPGGRYTVTIAAPGYVTQTKTLELAPGDQAIFHAELEKKR